MMAAAAEVHEALAEFQADMPVLTKDKRAHQSKYADLVQVTETILPRLNELGLVWLTCPTLLDDNRFVLEYQLRHVPSGTAIHGRWPLKLSENPQQMGSHVTYARRYSLLAVLSVAAEDEDDDGHAASGRNTAQRRQQPAAAPAAEGEKVQRRQPARTAPPPLPGDDPDGKVGQDQHRHMHALWRDLGYAGDENRDTRLSITAKILGLPDLESSAALTRGEADRVIAALRERKERTAGEAS